MIRVSYNVILLVAFFIIYSGIYILPQFGLRTDHIFIYLMLLFVLTYFFLLNRAISINSTIIALIVFLFLINLISLTSWSFFNKAVSGYEVVADIENYIQPIAIILITCFFILNFHNYSIDELIIKTIEVFLIFISINTFLAIILLYIGPGEYIYLIGGPPDNDGLNTVERALSASRSGGVFAQPIDAGIAYSIGMISWLYLFDKDKINLSYKPLFYIQLLLIIVGSILCGSKVSYILGWGLSLIYIFFYSDLYHRLFGKIKFIIITIIFIFIVYTGVKNWDGAAYLWRINQYFIFNKLIENLE